MTTTIIIIIYILNLKNRIVIVRYVIELSDFDLLSLFSGIGDCQSTGSGEEGERGKCKVLLKHRWLFEGEKVTII